MRDTIRFIRKGRVVEVRDVAPTETLLDYLRLRERACGTKEGCNEGDCGACTVAVGSVEGDRLIYRPVNACIQFVGQLDGKEIVTVEDIAGPSGLHPVQQAMVDHHGSQCGFCTPGIVMSLFSLYQDAARETPPSRAVIDEWLAGNLCRCTGYRPIVDAARTALASPADDMFTRSAEATTGVLQFLADDQDVFVGTEDAFFAAPRSVEALAALYGRHPDATLVAGATDVGLWITKQFRPIRKLIHLGRVDGLDRIEDLGPALIIGATATYEAAFDALAAVDPDVGAVLRRLGSRQVRASGTIGGNIANGSPIGDTPPMLIALGATLELVSAEANRAMPLEEFFLDYGVQDRRPSEFVAGVLVPKLKDDQVFRAYKISKRFDQDISAVLGAFLFTLRDGVITEARVAFGGMAAIPKRARAVEERLVGVSPASAAAWSPAIEAFAEDFQPLTDMRASAHYRLETARALLAKALLETAGAPTSRTRVVGHREPRQEAAHVGA
ncbi:xanthine dehydrogenase small subunit [Chthonobacter rhizosphaerae]|uniref:xanthine dehydrogenase small subunit n=1 Tax=Chthonobacter rhizosphaerae TaxID=2735553 RepID=UPI0015EEF890|nr:xanthine dehydrogenase small subunit [Chthonobacter rhizosphaerae]